MKDSTAFNNKTGVCYITEVGDEYTYADYLEIAKGNTKLVQILFGLSDWQHPETIFEELLRENEIDEHGNLLTSQ